MEVEEEDEDEIVEENETDLIKPDFTLLDEMVSPEKFKDSKQEYFNDVVKSLLFGKE